jgi:hypothetical protein
MTEALGAAGAACIVANKSSNRADWVCFSGLSERFRSDYVDHFARLDPFLPHLNVARRWIKLSDCLPQSLLRQSEWYNDFVLASRATTSNGSPRNKRATTAILRCTE